MYPDAEPETAGARPSVYPRGCAEARPLAANPSWETDMANAEAIIRILANKVANLQAAVDQCTTKYSEFVQACNDQPRSITAEIDAIPGRRIFYNFIAQIAFTAAQDGTRGAPLQWLVSQDGPFIQTHYPCVAWYPNAPDTATDLGRWRPVYSWPLPTQELGADIIDMSYEMIDSGSQRNFQNAASPPMFSRFDAALPLPVPTLFAPNTTIQMFPTYNNILFSDQGEGVDTTGGLLVAYLPGYKIVNM